MAQKISFKEYLDSKEKLREAVKTTPRQKLQYTVSKYCKLIVGESKEDKKSINLKPNHTIIVDWLYEDIENPTPINITFTNVNEIESDQTYHTNWPGSRLDRWLSKNAFEQF